MRSLTQLSYPLHAQHEARPGASAELYPSREDTTVPKPCPCQFDLPLVPRGWVSVPEAASSSHRMCPNTQCVSSACTKNRQRFACSVRFYCVSRIQWSIPGHLARRERLLPRLHLVEAPPALKLLRLRVPAGPKNMSWELHHMLHYASRTAELYLHMTEISEDLVV